jgi:hypothetical protein
MKGISRASKNRNGFQYPNTTQIPSLALSNCATFTARMASMKENQRILVAICIGALLGTIIVFAIEMARSIL